MILIADSGSTKTDWIVLDKGKKIFATTTVGLNPIFRTRKEIANALRSVNRFRKLSKQISEVNFYGAGCGNKKAKEKMQSALKTFFPKAKMNVQTDLLGAAIATCGKKKGIVCILGTGSNCCYYDGKKVQQGNAGLGYILGDEGSATYFGKKLLTQFFCGKLPGPLAKDFERQFKITRESVIENIYYKSNANRYLASFAEFILRHRRQKVIRQMIGEGLKEFFEKNISAVKHYKKLPVHFVGSVAFYLHDEVFQMGYKKKLDIISIWKNPIDGLETYYLAKKK